MLSFFVGTSRPMTIAPGVVRMSFGGAKEVFAEIEAYPEGGMAFGGAAAFAAYMPDSAGGLSFGGTAAVHHEGVLPFEFFIALLDASGAPLIKYRVARSD